MPYTYFDLSRYNPGVAKRPTGSAFAVSWAGAPPGARFEFDGWRANDSGRGYFPTGADVASEPRFSLTVTPSVFDLAALSFGPIFAGLTDTIPPTAANTALLGKHVGVQLRADTDDSPNRRAYPWMYNGTTTASIASYAAAYNFDADVGSPITFDFWMDAAGFLYMRSNGGHLGVTNTALSDMSAIWSYFVIGTSGVQTGTSGSSDTSVDFDLRTRQVDLRRMPVTTWNDEGSASPMVMG